jgi:hypothetical protein
VSIAAGAPLESPHMIFHIVPHVAAQIRREAPCRRCTSVGRAEILPYRFSLSPPAKIAAFQMVMFGKVVIRPAKIAYLFDGHGSTEKLK